MSLGAKLEHRARLRHDVLLDHRRAEVVAAEAQRHLADVRPHRRPRDLQVGEVVQVQARQREHAQVAHRRGVVPSLRRVPSAWNGQQMNAVNPAVSSCSARSRSKWPTTWRGSSPKPNTMVAVVRSPSACASRITSSHVSVEHLSGEICSGSRRRGSRRRRRDRVQPGGDQPLDHLRMGRRSISAM